MQESQLTLPTNRVRRGGGRGGGAKQSLISFMFNKSKKFNKFDLFFFFKKKKTRKKKKRRKEIKTNIKLIFLIETY